MDWLLGPPFLHLRFRGGLRSVYNDAYLTHLKVTHTRLRGLLLGGGTVQMVFEC